MRRLFTLDEDDLLMRILETEVFHGWKNVATRFHNRNARQVRDRYVNYLSKDVNNGQWTVSELRTMVDAYNEFGGKWSKIATKLEGRTEPAVKNIWHASIKSEAIVINNDHKAVLVGPPPLPTVRKRKPTVKPEFHFSDSFFREFEWEDG
jgi:hypothetical protein